MKIVCDNCATKYSIADEKVRGKVFKIRCKKCSHIIVVRGNEGGEPAHAAGDVPADAGADEAPASTTAASDAVWHLVIEGQQVGPFTPAEVRSKFSASECDVETYAWREGFADWLRLGSIEDFKDLAAAAPADDGATRRTDAADLFAKAAADEAASGDAGADLFGGKGAAKSGGGDVFQQPAAAQASASFAGSAEPAAAKPARASASAAAASSGGGGGADMATDNSSRMAGQRNENSVLFSLNNLQALASSNGPSAKSSGGGGGGAAKPGVDTRPGYANSQSEGSGLIDIRAMAASSLASGGSSSSSSKPDDLPALSAPPIFSPMAAPIMMPAPPQGMPKAMWIVIAIGGVLVLAMIAVTVIVLTRKPEVVATTNPPNVPTDPTKAAVPTDPTKSAVPADPTKAGAPKVDEPKAAAPEKAAEADKAPAAGKDRKHRDKGEKAAAMPGEPAKKGPAADKGVVAPPIADKPKPGKKKDDLDDLLDAGSPGGGSKKKESVDENLPETLDKTTIVGGMKKVSDKVQACYKQFNVPGLANVQTTISGSGRVSSATVSGAFSGTPTGSCVEKAVKSASFPKFKSASQTITYPFMLR